MRRRILSWNVNGIRAIERKGFSSWLTQEAADIVLLQETKAHPEQVPDLLRANGMYRSYWSRPERKGYSGVAVFTKEEPRAVWYGFGAHAYDAEGRVLVLDYGTWVLVNCYFPNGKQNAKRLAFKMDFYEQALAFVRRLRQQGVMVIIGGDVNTAHQAIDLARPEDNETESGFLPEERAWIDRLLGAGFIDTFRERFPGLTGQYTWWDYVTGARARNVGWRIDYFFMDRAHRKRLSDAFILPEVHGSDHCPIGVVIEV